VLDGVTEGMVLHGLDPLSNVDSARWGELLARPLAAAGAAVEELDHVVKDREQRGRYAIGAQHKLASIDVAYRLDAVEPFGRGREGLVRVTVTKDRPGHVRRHAVQGGRVAEMRLRSRENGSVSVRLDPPSGDDERFRPTHLMQRLSVALEDRPGMSAGDVRALRGKNDGLDAALAALVAEGHVEARQEGRAKRHYSLRPYRESDELAPPRGNLPPASSPSTLPPAPPLQGGGKLEDAEGQGERRQPAPQLAPGTEGA